MGGEESRVSGAQPPRRRTLREQLLLAFLPLGGAVLLGLGALQFAVGVRHEAAASAARLQAAAQAIALGCENYLGRHTAALGLLATDLQAEGAPLDPPTLFQHLRLCRDANPGFNTMIVVDRAGRVVAASPATNTAGVDVVASGHNVADRAYYQDALRGEGPQVSDAFLGRVFGGEPIVAVSAPLRAPRGEVVGVIEGSLNLRRLHDLLGPEQAILDRTVLIVDRGGRVVLSTVPEYPLLTPVDVRTLGADGGYVTGSARTSTGGWQVIVLRPRTSLQAAVLQSEMWTWLALLGALAIFAGLVFRASSRVAQPVRDLERRLGTFSLADRPAPLPTAPDASSETAALIAAWNDMAERLGSAHDDLARTLDGLEERVRERTAALAVSEQRYRELVEQTLGFMCEHDLEGNLLMVNPAAARSLGYSPGELAGHNLREFLPPAAHNRLREYLAAIAHDGQADGLLEVVTRSGEHRIWHFHNIRVREEPRPPHVIGHAVDVTERRRAEQEAERRALHDPLTGAGNRDLFDSHLQVALARAGRSGERVAVLYLDLDSFKDVNDQFGHAAGDRLLRAMVSEMRQAVRGADTIARLGGDEFGLILPGVGSAENALQVAAKLSDVLVRAGRTAGLFGTVTASVGVALYPEDARTPSELVAQADAAMYRAKARGSGRCATAGDPAAGDPAAGDPAAGDPVDAPST